MIKKRYIFESDNDNILEKLDSKIKDILEELQNNSLYEEDEEYEEEYSPVEILLDEYSELLANRKFCFECVRSILQEFSLDLLNEFFDY